MNTVKLRQIQGESNVFTTEVLKILKVKSLRQSQERGGVRCLVWTTLQCNTSLNPTCTTRVGAGDIVTHSSLDTHHYNRRPANVTELNEPV